MNFIFNIHFSMGHARIVVQIKWKMHLRFNLLLTIDANFLAFLLFTLFYILRRQSRVICSPKPGDKVVLFLKKKRLLFLWCDFRSLIILTARIFFRQPCNQVLMVCLATSSSIMYSNSSRARSSSNWSAFLMSTERYDNILKKILQVRKILTI